MSVTDRDHGYRALFQRLAKQNQGRVVDVGVMGKSAAAPHLGSGLSVGDIATIQEFGIGVPERSFIRAYVDENRQWIEDQIRKMAKMVITGNIPSFDEGLRTLGEMIEKEIKSRIMSGVGAPNDQVTIDEKESSTPLIDTEQLLNAIVHELRTIGG